MRSRKISFYAVLVLAAAGCTDEVRVTGRACPCVADQFCCPVSNTCAADEAACDRLPTIAPSSLTFTRLSATSGEFSWDPVGGATSYALYLNGIETARTALTTATLEIGTGEVDVRVAALNDVGPSPKSGSFPVLFDVSVRACASDAVEARWKTAASTDTQLSVERAGENTIACVDPTLRQDHLYGDVAGCTQVGVPSGTAGVLDPASPLTVNLMSRDELGFLGKYQTTFTMPGQSCLCASSSKRTLGGCNRTPIVGPMGSGLPDIPACGRAFDLEAGKLVDNTNQGDMYLEATEDADGWLSEVRLVAPRGVAVLNNTAMCDVVQAPASGYDQNVVIHAAASGRDRPPQAERTTTFVVKTRNGRYAKVSLECNCPTSATEAGFGDLGMRFGWRVTAAGSMVFND